MNIRIFRNSLLWLLVLTLLSSATIHAQTTIYEQDFSATFATGTDTEFLPKWHGNDIRNTNTRIHQESEGSNKALGLIPVSATNLEVIVSLDCTGYTSNAISFQIRSKTNGSGSRPNNVTISYSHNGGDSWHDSTLVGSFPNVDGAYSTHMYTLPPSFDNNSNVKIKIYSERGDGSGNTAEVIVDNFTLFGHSGPMLLPSVAAVDKMSYLESIGGSSSIDSFMISGSSLSPASGMLKLTPPDNFEISVDNITYTSDSLLIPYTTSSISITKIYTRLKAGLTAQTYYGMLSASVGTLDTTVQLVGYVYLDAAPTFFNPGELFITAFDANLGAGVDRYYVASLVPIGPGTEFKLVNSRYEAGAPAEASTTKWGGPGNVAGEQPGIAKITYTGTEYIPAGSIISFSIGSTSPYDFEINGSPTTFITGVLELAMGSTTSSAPNISTSSPDQIYLVQGMFIYDGIMNADEANYYLKGNVLFGMSLGIDWVPITMANSGGDLVSNRTSRIPPQIQCFNIARTIMPAYGYFRNSTTHTGNIRDILGDVKRTTDNNYWNFSNTGSNSSTPDFVINYYSSNFTDACKRYIITEDFPDGTWRGDVDNNWFNCENWEGYAVPNFTTDVYINEISHGANHAIIKADAPYAAEYNFIAQVNNISIGNTDRKLIIEGENDTLIVYGNLTIEEGGMIDMNDDNVLTMDGNIILLGDWINHEGILGFNAGNSFVKMMNGSNSQKIEINGSQTFNRLILDNTNGYELDGAISIITALDLQNAMIHNAPSSIIELNHGAIVSNVSPSNFVNGKVRKIGNTAFTFPIGKAGVYRPVSISAPANVTDAFEVEYMDVAPMDPMSLASTLDHISMVEYWEVNRFTGSSTVDVSFTWNDNSMVVNTEDLRIAHYNGTFWEDLGSSSIDTSNKIIRVNSVSAFSPFTLATNTPAQPLPVSLIQFNANVKQLGQHEITWELSNDKSIKSIALMHGIDGVHFRKIGSFTPIESTYINDNVNNGKNYYQLIITMDDESNIYSEVKLINESFNGEYQVYPNPFNEYITVKNAQELDYVIYDMKGTTLLKGTCNSDEYVISTQSLISGAYQLELRNATRRVIFQIIKQ